VARATVAQYRAAIATFGEPAERSQ
jgi:hypothetical protein